MKSRRNGVLGETHLCFSIVFGTGSVRAFESSTRLSAEPVTLVLRLSPSPPRRTAESRPFPSRRPNRAPVRRFYRITHDAVVGTDHLPSPRGNGGRVRFGRCDTDAPVYSATCPRASRAFYRGLGTRRLSIRRQVARLVGSVGRKSVVPTRYRPRARARKI